MNKHILVVEDNASTRELFLDILQAFKFKTTVLRTGQEVIDYFDEETNERPNVLLLDINLPEKNGVYVLQYLRGKLKLNDLKILVITANHIAGQMPEMNLADIVMTKPFLPNMLKEKIDALLTEQTDAQSADSVEDTVNKEETNEVTAEAKAEDTVKTEIPSAKDADVTMEASIVRLAPDDNTLDDDETEAVIPSTSSNVDRITEDDDSETVEMPAMTGKTLREDIKESPAI